MSAELPAWLPRGGVQPQPVPCGEEFDAVCVPSLRGLVTLGRLEQPGPVIEDLALGVMLWLVKPGAADLWQPLPQVDVLGPGLEILVPPAQVEAGQSLRWAIPPAGDCLTDADELYQVLAAVVSGRPPEHYTSAECRMREHHECRHGEVPASAQGVTHLRCECPCHKPTRSALAAVGAR